MVIALLTGCAPLGEPGSPGKPADRTRASFAAHGEMPIWRFDDLAKATQPVVFLRSPASGVTIRFETAHARRVQTVAAKIVSVAGNGETPDWFLVGTPSINAFATYQNGQPLVVVTLGMVTLLESDEGAWAALAAHELAHFRLGHHQAQRFRKETVTLGSSLAGLVLSVAGLGIGSVAADAAGTLVERSFSRDDERDADRVGLDYVRHAGFDPQGALRLQTLMLDPKRESAPTFLSTHPSGQDRIEAIRQLLIQPDPAARR
jgi:predicted Zn-dependent protease